MHSKPRHVIYRIVDRLDRVRGISAQERHNLRLERARMRYLSRASGPSHSAEINAVFDRELETATR